MKSISGFSFVILVVGATFLAAEGRAQEIGGAGDPSCAGYAEACGSGCGDSCVSDACYRRWGSFKAYGDFLYLRPSNAGIEYAVPINGPIAANAVPLQAGPTGIVDPNFGAGYRVGFDAGLGNCGSFYAEFTNFHSTTDDSISTTAPLVLRSMVLNPSSLNAGSDWLNAAAEETTEFDLVDFGYHYNLWGCNQNSVGLLVGVRYGHLGQKFDAVYDNIITETVNSQVNYDCVGPRFGIDGNWCIGRGFFVHGKTSASIVGGEFRADYTDVQVAAPQTPIDTTTWHEARVTGIFDGEVALGWQNCTGSCKVMVGYSITDWCNVVKPSDFIAGVQNNNYRGANQLGQTALLFDGFMVHAEMNW